jgi:hypothetical protein
LPAEWETQVAALKKRLAVVSRVLRPALLAYPPLLLPVQLGPVERLEAQFGRGQR